MVWMVVSQQLALAQLQNATVMINKDSRFQKITGFGGFVNSPQFGYGHMSESEIRKMWGKESEAGYNIMRIYIPIGEAGWPQSVATAQLAQSLGIKIFASPWSMPAIWKTHNTEASRYQDANGQWQPVYLSEDHYGDYADYLNKFVTYLRDHDVELYGISLQNEPDWQVDYAGCIWTPAQMANFIKNYADRIDCRIIAPETVGIPNSFANAFMDPDVLANFDIFGGHQYGAIQSGLLNVQAQGKEVWMTEFLINWNSNSNIPERNFNWQIDAFDFASSVNNALLANINAWVHYATKRYYGQMGDGLYGTVSGEITKRGNILTQFAKYTTGSTRVQTNWTDNSGQLTGSSYLSVTGDSVIVMVINPSSNTYSLSVDLPFLSSSGKTITTTSAASLVEAQIAFTGETARPKVNISPSSVTTIVITKSGEREVSLMQSELIHYGQIEKQSVTNPAFGTAYQLSGKTVTFKHDLPLFSTNTTASNGYVAIDGKFNRLVFRIENLTTTNALSSAQNTLYYVDNDGVVRSHNYGDVNFGRTANFDWVFDISENVLPNGCAGIIGFRNNNHSSHLGIKFGNVYLAVGSEKGYKFTGPYSSTDSYLLDVFDDPNYTSLDFDEVTNIDPETDWHTAFPNKNAVFYAQDAALSGKSNVVIGGTSEKLELSDNGGNFYPPVPFSTTTATYHATLNGLKILVLPFEADIPQDVKAYTLQFTAPRIIGTIITNGKIPANTPVLVKGSGNFSFEGSGAIASSQNLRLNAGDEGGSNLRTLQVGIMGGVFIGVNAPIGGYYLDDSGETPVFTRATAASRPVISSFGGYIAPGLETTDPTLELLLDESALPVRLGRFTAKYIESSVQLDWITHSEENNARFEVERSTDGREFGIIGSVEGLGNSSSEQRYSLVDPKPFGGVSYYRLKQIDLDGSYTYSQIRSVHNKDSEKVIAYPNPVRDILTVDAKGNQVSGKVVVFDIIGRAVLQSELGNSGQVGLDVSRLSPGLYFYKVDSFTGTFVRQ